MCTALKIVPGTRVCLVLALNIYYHHYLINSCSLHTKDALRRQDLILPWNLFEEGPDSNSYQPVEIPTRSPDWSKANHQNS